MNAWNWHSTERAILRAFALQVRLMTVDQIARIWFSNAPTPTEYSRDAVGRLEEAGLLRRQIVEAHPLGGMNGPYNLTVSKNVTPSSTADRIKEIAFCLFMAGP